MKLLVIITCAVEIILRLQIFKLIVTNYPDFRKVRKYKAEQEFKTKYEAQYSKGNHIITFLQDKIFRKIIITRLHEDLTEENHDEQYFS